MEENNDARLQDGDGHEDSVWHARKPGVSARCSQCGSAEIANLPTFSNGNGNAFRTLDDDVYCRRCGAMGQPTYELSEEERKRPSPEAIKKRGKQSGQSR